MKRQSHVVILVGCVLSLTLFVHVIIRSQDSSANGTFSSGAVLFIGKNAPGGKVILHADSELSMRLKIPKINVDAVIEYVGLTSDGAMDTPKGPDDVALFDLGPRPGESGSAVIAGHYGWKNEHASVFDSLHMLRKGDAVFIENEQGATVSFTVRDIRTYDPKTDTSTVFGSNDGKSHLNLVTCEGEWNESSHGYSKRLVVFTDRETE